MVAPPTFHGRTRSIQGWHCLFILNVYAADHRFSVLPVLPKPEDTQSFKGIYTVFVLAEVASINTEEVAEVILEATRSGIEAGEANGFNSGSVKEK
jgi:hypothetical protein